MQSAVLLGRRGTSNIWPFASYAALKSREEPIVERVPVAALQLRVAVDAANAEIMRKRGRW